MLQFLDTHSSLPQFSLKCTCIQPAYTQNTPRTLFCSLAVLDPRVGHTMDVHCPLITWLNFTNDYQFLTEMLTGTGSIVWLISSCCKLYLTSRPHHKYRCSLLQQTQRLGLRVLGTSASPTKRDAVWADSRRTKEPQLDRGIYWRHLANTMERSVRWRCGLSLPLHCLHSFISPQNMIAKQNRNRT